MKRLILGIDPGPEVSGAVIFDPNRGIVIWAGVPTTEDLLQMARTRFPDRLECPMGILDLAVERIVSYGTAVGNETFRTCETVGRLMEMWHGVNDSAAISRPDVLRWLGVQVKRLTPKMKAAGEKKGPSADALCRQVLLDKLGPVGTKKNPGPLYGVGSHSWAALAVAVAFAEMREQDDRT